MSARRKQKKIGMRGLWALLLVLSGIALYCGARILMLQWQEKQNKTVYEQLQIEAFSSGQKAAQAQDQAGYVPPVPFAALQQINRDTVAWLRCEGTPVSYPVVQCSDNEYYLKHDIHKEWSTAGCIFLDCGNESDFSDKQSIVFGHNFYRNDLMFTSLLRYKKQDYYDAFPEMTLNTPTAEYTVQLFSGYEIAADQYDLKANYAAPQEYEQFLREAQEKSDFISKVTPAATDRVFTMCTCSESGEDERYLLHGVLKLTAGEE
ncbi:MAG: class B sortase [Ruthenibacterium sp.]